jgi:ABC-type transport system substrate-binding protein
MEVNIRFHMESPLTGPIFEQVSDTHKVEGDDFTLIVDLIEPVVTFPMVFSSQIGVVAAPQMLLADGGGNRDPIGTGPFMFDEWEEGNFLRVVRNPDYWQDDDPGTRASALRSGDVDIAQINIAGDMADFQDEAGDGRWQVLSDDDGELFESFIQLNTAGGPTADPEVRRILALATNTDQFTETIHDGLFDTSRGMFHPGSPWYVDTDYPEFDLDAAIEAVDAWEAENGPLEIKISTVPIPVALAGVQLIQQNWEDAGIDAEIISEALNAARQDPEDANQKGYYDVVQQELAQDIPYVWLVHEQTAIVAKPNLVDIFNANLPGGGRAMALENRAHPLAQVWIRPG